MTEKKNDQGLPWAAGVGLLSAVLGVIALVSGQPLGLVLIVMGVVGISWGYSSREKKQRHDELMAEMRRQRAE